MSLVASANSQQSTDAQVQQPASGVRNVVCLDWVRDIGCAFLCPHCERDYENTRPAVKAYFTIAGAGEDSTFGYYRLTPAQADNYAKAVARDEVKSGYTISFVGDTLVVHARDEAPYNERVSRDVLCAYFAAGSVLTSRKEHSCASGQGHIFAAWT